MLNLNNRTYSTLTLCCSSVVLLRLFYNDKQICVKMLCIYLFVFEIVVSTTPLHVVRPPPFPPQFRLWDSQLCWLLALWAIVWCVILFSVVVCCHCATMRTFVLWNHQKMNWKWKRKMWNSWKEVKCATEMARDNKWYLKPKCHST